jgi:hypothetical protein
MSKTLKKLNTEDISEINNELKEIGLFIVDLKQDLQKLLDALKQSDAEINILKNRDEKDIGLSTSAKRMRIWTLGQSDITTIDSFKKLLLDLGLNIQELKKEFGLLNESIQKFI